MNTWEICLFPLTRSAPYSSLSVSPNCRDWMRREKVRPRHELATEYTHARTHENEPLSHTITHWKRKKKTRWDKIRFSFHGRPVGEKNREETFSPAHTRNKANLLQGNIWPTREREREREACLTVHAWVKLCMYDWIGDGRQSEMSEEVFWSVGRILWQVSSFSV